MASYTPNLNLYKKDPVADASDTFNIKTMMNDNWDKIDAFKTLCLNSETGSGITTTDSTHVSVTFELSKPLLIVLTGESRSTSGYLPSQIVIYTAVTGAVLGGTSSADTLLPAPAISGNTWTFTVASPANLQRWSYVAIGK